jgi:hypothetical protein
MLNAKHRIRYDENAFLFLVITILMDEGKRCRWNPSMNFHLFRRRPIWLLLDLRSTRLNWIATFGSSLVDWKLLNEMRPLWLNFIGKICFRLQFTMGHFKCCCWWWTMLYFSEVLALNEVFWCFNVDHEWMKVLIFSRLSACRQCPELCFFMIR